MGGRLIAVVVTAAVLGTACTPSKVDPDAAVRIEGAATHADGRPVAGQPVALHVDPGPSLLFWTPLIVGTFGAACATDLCGADHLSHTDASGAYAFDLRGREVQGSFGEEVGLLLEAAVPEGPDELVGASGRIAFVAQAEHTTLPQLRLWQPTISIASASVSWSPAAADASTHRVLFQRTDGAVLWDAPATADGLSIDPRILEDTAGGVAATAAVAHPPEVSSIELRSGTRRYRSLAGAPASRGAACAVLTDDGAHTPVTPCPVTDGDLVTWTDLVPVCPQEGPCPRVVGVEVDLGAPVPVELVVVRGCVDCQVEVGEVGTQLTETSAAVPVTQTASTVTLRGQLDELAEVSVWDRPAAGGLEAVAVDAPDPDDPTAVPVAGGQGGTSQHDASRALWPVLLAVLLLGAAVGALLSVTLQRRGAG